MERKEFHCTLVDRDAERVDDFLNRAFVNPRNMYVDTGNVAFSRIEKYYSILLHARARARNVATIIEIAIFYYPPQLH